MMQRMIAMGGGESGGAQNIWDSFPDLSDGSAMTISNNRITNVTKNKSKKIGTDVYIELAGTLAVTSSVSGWNYYKIVEPVSGVTQTSGKEMDVWYGYTPTSVFITPFLTDSIGIGVVVHGSGSITSDIDLKIIVHGQ